jgi:hypothetical protein
VTLYVLPVELPILPAGSDRTARDPIQLTGPDVVQLGQDVVAA